jgi:hypothetical protein
MLNRAKTLKGYKLHCRDGEMGKAKEFYFDDHHWAIRYLVADTGNWLTGRQVLISPYALISVNKEGHYINVDLTKKRIEESPSIDSDKPVSRQFEKMYCGYYGWPMYDGGPHMWGTYPHIERDRKKWRESDQSEKMWDSHLRSTRDVSGYRIEARDGAIGHVDDFIIDGELWAIRYLLVETGSWWPGKKVLLSPRWIDSIDWSQSKVFVNLQRETSKQATEYREESPITRDYEAGLHRHYNHEGYWVDELAAKEHSHLQL